MCAVAKCIFHPNGGIANRYAFTQQLQNAETRDRTGDLQIFGLTLSQLSYRGLASVANIRRLSQDA